MKLTLACQPRGPAGPNGRNLRPTRVWGKAENWIHLTWFGKVPRDSHHWLLLLLGDHPVEEKLPQMAQETSFSPKSLPPSPSPGHSHKRKLEELQGM